MSRGGQISSKANVPKWTNLLEYQCPEVDKYPQMLMSRGRQISSNVKCPEVDKSPQKPMSRGGQISLDVNVPKWTNFLKSQCPVVDESPRMSMSRGG